MYYDRKNLGQAERTIQDPDPYQPFEEPESGMEYRVAAPLMGPWYQGWYRWPFGASPHLGPESFYESRSYPHPQINPFLPRWTGSFIQARNIDPIAGELMMSGLSQNLWRDFYIEDPTGGEYWGVTGPLGPGASIGVASQWAGSLKPRGFTALGS